MSEQQLTPEQIKALLANFTEEEKQQLLTESKIAQYSKEETSDFKEEELIEQRAEVVNEKPLIKLFVSYARKDNKDDNKVKKFLDELEEHFNASKQYRYKWWTDWKILIGENWDAEIKNALKVCDFGLLMVSLPFLNSQYIRKNELPVLLATERALPVGFVQLDLKQYDLRGLQPKQIFQHDDKFYDRCTGNKRKDFIANLFLQIEAKIIKSKANKPTRITSQQLITRWMWRDIEKEECEHYIRNKAQAADIKNVQTLIQQKQQADDSGIVAMTF